MTDSKEPGYFSEDPVLAKGADWYFGLFADAAPDDPSLDLAYPFAS